MSRRLHSLAVLVLAIQAAAQDPASESEPAQVDPIEAAIEALQDPSTRTAAVTELYRAGRKAVPALARLLMEDPEGTRELDARRAALRVLEYLGPDAEDALDALVACLSKSDLTTLREDVFRVLGRTAPYLGDRAAQVSKALGDECDKGKYFGYTGFFETLSRLTFDARVDVPELVAGLRHENPYVRVLAAEALTLHARELRSDDENRENVVKALRDTIEGDHPTDFKLEWKWNGNQASTSGGANEVAQSIRVAAASALALIDPQDPLVAPGLVRLLHHVDPDLQVEAARGLGALGEDGAEGVDDLAEMLTESEPVAAYEAATALGMIGEKAKSAIPALEKAAESQDRQLAARAKAALRQIPH